MREKLDFWLLITRSICIILIIMILIKAKILTQNLNQVSFIRIYGNKYIGFLKKPKLSVLPSSVGEKNLTIYE